MQQDENLWFLVLHFGSQEVQGKAGGVKDALSRVFDNQASLKQSRVQCFDAIKGRARIVAGPGLMQLVGKEFGGGRREYSVDAQKLQQFPLVSPDASKYLLYDLRPSRGQSIADLLLLGPVVCEQRVHVEDGEPVRSCAKLGCRVFYDGRVPADTWVSLRPSCLTRSGSLLKMGSLNRCTRSATKSDFPLNGSRSSNISKC